MFVLATHLSDSLSSKGKLWIDFNRTRSDAYYMQLPFARLENVVRK